MINELVIPKIQSELAKQLDDARWRGCVKHWERFKAGHIEHYSVTFNSDDDGAIGRVRTHIYGIIGNHGWVKMPDLDRIEIYFDRSNG